MKKVTKGKAGYLAEKKKRLGLQALAEFAVVALILIIGYVITKTRLNIFTVVAIVGCLPAARVLVEFIMLYHLERRIKKEKKKPKPRSEKEQNYISNAKRLLMEKNQMTEEEAYRHIQKCSMDSGTNMVETAQMLLMLMYDEI